MSLLSPPKGQENLPFSREKRRTKIIPFSFSLLKVTIATKINLSGFISSVE